MRLVLLIPVETARRLRPGFPGNSGISGWEQTKCPHCPRLCWIGGYSRELVASGVGAAICILCAAEQSIHPGVDFEREEPDAKSKVR